MTDNDPRAAWAAAFVQAQAKLPDVPKTRTAEIPTKSGGSYSYTYADLGDVLDACRPVLNQHGLSITQSVGGDRGEVRITTRIYHEAGHVEEFGPTTLAAGGDARGTGSAITYARRYGACAALGIVPDEDDDGAAATVQSERPEFNLTAWAAHNVQVFSQWDEDRRKLEWVEAVKDCFGDRQPRDPDEAGRVIDAMAKVYYSEFPPSDDEAPF